MSSFARRIARQQVGTDRSLPKGATEFCKADPRKKFFGSRGSKLGVKNAKDPCVTGKRKQPKKWRSPVNAPDAKPKFKFVDSPVSPARDHKAEMLRRQRVRDHFYGLATDADRIARRLGVEAGINRHTMQPHENKREKARHSRQALRVL